MDKNTIRQLALLAFSSLVLYFSGIYLMTIGNLKTIFDGFITMIFFFAIFPFLSIFTLLSKKALKAVASVNNS
jgi:hypothetical protein|tara:strand:+ start:518 stop:736 length:219 start_codon:yes stop_codon:yes gene_type:complete